MDIWIIIALVAAVVILCGVVVFLLIKMKLRQKPKDSADEYYADEPKSNTVKYSINTDVGECKAMGTKDNFNITFNNGEISFLVEGGKITGYKTKKQNIYIKYSIEGGY